jgi:hypothetical protein
MTNLLAPTRKERWRVRRDYDLAMTFTSATLQPNCGILDHCCVEMSLRLIDEHETRSHGSRGIIKRTDYSRISWRGGEHAELPGALLSRTQPGRASCKFSIEPKVTNLLKPCHW